MQVMLLAAGRSTRLGPLGQQLPKPLVPICGYPAIRFGLAACAAAGLREVVINLFHRGDRIRESLGDGGADGVRIRYSEESELLGTAGGIAQAAPWLGEGPILVMNAKVVADVDLAAVVRAHGRVDPSQPAAEATLVVREDPRAEEWGAVAVAPDEQIVSILDRPARAATAPDLPSLTRCMFTGIQVVGSRLRGRMRPVFSDTVRDVYIPALEEGLSLRAESLRGYFAEHSTVERYWAGNLALLRAPGSIRHVPGPLVGVDPAATVHPRASIVGPIRIAAGAVIEAGASVGPDVVVGERAVVRAGARLTETVVWAGATVSGDLRRAIVTPQQIVAVA